MNKQEALKFKEILKLVRDATETIKKTCYSLSEIEAYQQIFGKSEKPYWADEDHIHLFNTGEIIEIRFKEDGIYFYSESWKTCRGFQIYGLFPFYKNKWVKGKGNIETDAVYYGYNKRHKKYEWNTVVGWGNRTSVFGDDEIVDSYTSYVADSVLHYIVECFKIDNVRASLALYKSINAKKEFGLSINNSYYMKNSEKYDVITNKTNDSCVVGVVEKQ